MKGALDCRSHLDRNDSKTYFKSRQADSFVIIRFEKGQSSRSAFALKELIKNASRQTPCVTTLTNKELNRSVRQISVGILLSSLL